MTNEEMFREHWNWLGETGCEFKEEWPKFTLNGGDTTTPKHTCFACKKAIERSGIADCSVYCNSCPINWDHIDFIGHAHCIAENDIDSDGTLYDKWWDAEDVESCKHYAKLVAELP